MQPALTNAYPGSDPPLLIVGRRQEQLLLRDYLANAQAGHGRLVLVGGEAGIGKTTLVDDLSREAAARSILVAAGSCYDLTVTPPYGPWLDVFRVFNNRPDGFPVPMNPQGLDVPNPTVLFDRVRQYLQQISSEQPVVIILEDIHWADQASLDLLRSLGRQLHTTRALVLVSYRSDEVTAGHPLYRLLPLLVREGRAARIDLQPLDEPALRTWVTTRYQLNDADVNRLVNYLIRNADGNPLFASEVLRAIEEQQLLSPTNGTWNLGDIDTVPVPRLLQQIIDGRMQKLAPESHQLLAVAAVIGHDIALDLWAQAAAVDLDRLYDTVDEVSTWMVHPSSDGTRVSFRHALFHEALYARILPPRRRAWHKRVAEVLEGTQDPDPDVVAYHYQRAGDIRAVEWLARAGRRAWQSWAWVQAAERYQAAINLLKPMPDHDEQRAWYLLRLAESRHYNAPHEGLNCVDAAEDIARERDHPALKAMCLWIRGRLRVASDEFGLTDLEVAVAAIEKLEPSERSNIRAQLDFDVSHCPAILAVWLAICGRYADALDTAGAYLELPRAERPPIIDAEAFLARGIALAAVGRPAESRRAFEMALDIYVRLEEMLSIAHTAYLYLIETLLPYYADDLTERERVIEMGSRAWEQSSERTITQTPFIALPVMLLDGRWEEARNIASRGLNVRNYVRVWTCPFGGALARLQGNPTLARVYLNAGLPADLSFGSGMVWLTFTLMHVQLAMELALDEGNHLAARDWLDHYERLVDVSDRRSARAASRLLEARCHLAAGQASDARRVAEQSIELATQPRQPLVLLAANRLLARLDIQDGLYEQARAPLDRARALADSCRATHERAKVLVIDAELALAMGDLEQSVRAIEEAHDVVGSLHAEPLVNHLDQIRHRLVSTEGAYPDQLTEREVEVLRFVASGSTDAEIAEALFISPRTVMTHVSNILGKTGTTSRAAAAAYAVRKGLA